MSKVGGPTGPKETQQSSTVEETRSSSQTSESAKSEQTASPSQDKASADHAQSKMSESKLGGQVMQSQLQSAVSTGHDIDGHTRTTPGPASPQSIDITKDPGFQALPKTTQDKLLKDISKNSETASKFEKITNHKVYEQMTTEQKTKLLNVFSNLGPKGQTSLTDLMNREVIVGSGDPPPRMPALLTGDNTKSQTTLLDHLNKMSDQKMHPSLADRRKEILADVIQQTGMPSWHLDQGVTGTCAPTTVQQHLLQHSPAEYARIIGGLSGPDQSVKLANGDKMDAAKNQAGKLVATGTPPQFNQDPRSVTERMFQSAVQQHGDRLNKGANYKFDANTDNTGLWDQQTAHVMKGLYDRDYAWHPPGTGSKGISNAESDPAKRTEMRNKLYGEVKNEMDSRQGPVAVHLIWGGNAPDGKPHGLHEVLVEKIEGGRVYFRNPWGSSKSQGPDYKDGSDIAGPPPRRVDDSMSGLESMTEQQFQALINGASIGPPVGGTRT